MVLAATVPAVELGRDHSTPRFRKVDQLAKKAAEIALRLAALPEDGLRNNQAALDALEQLATQVLKEVAAARIGKGRDIGESSGTWRAMQPIRH